MRPANMLLCCLLCFLVVNVGSNVAGNISGTDANNHSTDANVTGTIGNETKPVVHDLSTATPINTTLTPTAAKVADASTSHTPAAPSSEVPLSVGDPALHKDDEEIHGVVEIEDELHHDTDYESDDSNDHEDL